MNGVERITCECPTCTPTRSLSSSAISSLPASNVSLNQPKSADGDGPVCSSDGVTFASECELRKFSCEQQAKHITIKHKGACRKLKGLFWLINFERPLNDSTANHLGFALLAYLSFRLNLDDLFFWGRFLRLLRRFCRRVLHCKSS